MLLRFVFLPTVFCCLVGAKNEGYRGYKVYNIELKALKQQEDISKLKSDMVDFWRAPNYKYGVVGQAMVPPSHFDWFEEKLQEMGINRDIFIEDVYEHLTILDNKTRISRSADEDYKHYFDVNKYHRYDDILAYLRKLHEQSVDALSKVELLEYGVTAEKRPLVYLRVTRESNQNTQKPIIVIEAATNPRDWVTIPAALNIVENLLKESRFLDDLEWIVVPVLNPDGYEYTHSNLRLWQKSRSTSSNMGHICPGVNINRNFDIDWQNFDASSSPCSHVYAGVEPFSEIESRMIKDIIKQNAPRVKMYMSLQNNGGYVSIPWYYERAASGMFVPHYRLGLDMVKAMKETYKLDIGSSIFDRASGTSCDYIRRQTVLYTYNLDIVQRGNGVIIPEEDVSAIADDVWKAVTAAAEQMIRLYGTKYSVFVFTPFLPVSFFWVAIMTKPDSKKRRQHGHPLHCHNNFGE